MARTVSVSELKTHCLRIVGEVASRRREIVVTRRGKQVARIVPVDDAPPADALLGLRETLVKGTELSDFDTGATWQAARR